MYLEVILEYNTDIHLLWKIFIFVYRMGRLSGGAHEISGIKAPIFLRGWVGSGGVGGVMGGAGWGD